MFTTWAKTDLWTKRDKCLLDGDYNMYQAKNECVHDGIKNICGVGEIDSYRITGGIFT